MEQQIEYNRAKYWQLLFYPMCFGANNLFVVVMMFVSYVATGSYGLSVATAALVVTASRILDGFTDPLLALLADRLNTKFGKARILLLTGFLISAISIYSIFYTTVGTSGITFIALYILYIIGYTIFGIGQQIGNAIITNDPRQRPIIFRYQQIYTTILGSLVGIYMAVVLAPKYGGLTPDAMKELCATALVIGTLFVALSLIAIGSKDKYETFANANKKTRTTFKDMWKLLRHNKQLRAFIVAATSDKLALQAQSNSAITTIIFGIIIGNYAFNGTLTFINMFVSLILIFTATKFAGKYGAKKSVVVCTKISIVIAVLIAIYMIIINPTNISVVPVITFIFIALNALFAAAKVATSACTGSMLPDVIDYEFSESGKYMPATVAAVYTFIDKLVSSLATTIVGFCIALVGYKDVMPQPGDPVTTEIFAMGLFLWMGLPILGWLCTVIAMKFYKLDKEKMEEIQIINHKIRSEQA